MTRCPACGCDAAAGASTHALQQALRNDDLDRAITLGLLDDTTSCEACSDACRNTLAAARLQRQRALAARERFRAREARLRRRARERVLPKLPPAAAAALARAKARAASRKP